MVTNDMSRTGCDGRGGIQRVFLIMVLFTALCCRAAGGAEAPASDRSEELRAAVTSYVLQKTAGSGWETRIKRITLGGKVVAPEGALEFEVIAPQQWEGWGKANLSVVARQRDRAVLNVPVQVEVEALTDMVVALRQIDHGTLISAADVALKRQDISTGGGKHATSLDSVVGRRAKSTIKANAPVRTDQTEKIPIVRSGQLVTIVAENEIMKITVAGKAKSAGAEGDVIMVQNLNSLKEIPARVINSTMVQVSF
jgi:flagella basal body P-ring formation protein FlgA